ncbi:hypothetical protein RUM44_000574 [Polyplax serrata]|uniref:DNA topoisomerase n=1 Tax=Polyplax serrata TaxID=468196 RepID=A0ABR1B5V0_POLSC
MKILNVAEKNDAAKNIAAFLSGGRAFKRNGLSPYNKIYEFECEVFNQHHKMVMTSVSGHLLSMDFMGQHRNWNAVNPLSLFEAPVKKGCPASSQAVMKNIQKEVVSCNALIIWTDCDREGENIGYEVIDVCKEVKPTIRVYRAKFSEITKVSIQRAIKNLGEPNPHLNDAVNVRMELDLRIGAAFTRFQCINLRKAFPDALKDSLVSYGSCQFPTLGFVVERFKAISEFVTETFWKINVQHTIDDLTVGFNWKRVHLFDKLACEVLYDKCLECKTARVDKVESKPKSKWKPKPLDTVELEKIASRKLKINAKEALRVAEKLYTQGLISYPRTETNIFPKELNLVPLVEMQVGDSNWGEFAQRVLRDGPRPSQGNKSDQAHPPIHPIKYTNSLTGNEKRIYEFVVRHFLACLSKNAEGLETVVDISIAEEMFTAKGLMVTAKNYLEVYPYDKWSDKEIHLYRVGDTFTPDISLNEGATNPPDLLTEADLISLMEKHGIGTDATHAEHIETIKSRLYVGIQNEKYFVPRTLGMGLVEAYINMGYEMANPKLRADLEADLKKICENQKSPREVLRTHINNYREVFEGVQRQVSRLAETIQTYIQVEALPVEPTTAEDNTIDTVMTCPSCGAPMLLKEKKNNTGYYIGCSTYPHCRHAIWLPSMVTRVEVMDETCPTCRPQSRLLKFNFDRGSCYLPNDYISCLSGCDQNLLGVLNCNRKPQNNTQLASHQRSDHSLPLREVNDSGFSSFNSRAGSSGQEKFASNSSSALVNSSVPLCNCNLSAIELTVKKKGPNCGRIFYKCSGRNNQCNFFEWKNPEDGTRGAKRKSGGTNRTQVEVEDENDIRCYCAVHGRRLVVSKEGPNKGREFFACGKSATDSDKCNFFKWAT